MTDCSKCNHPDNYHDPIIGCHACKDCGIPYYKCTCVVVNQCGCEILVK